MVDMESPSLDVILAWAAEVFPDEKRHPYVVDNEDWDKITPILVSLEQLMGEWIGDVQDQAELARWKHVMRVVMEILYVMGVQRGETYRR